MRKEVEILTNSEAKSLTRSEILEISKHKKDNRKKVSCRIDKDVYNMFKLKHPEKIYNTTKLIANMIIYDHTELPREHEREMTSQNKRQLLKDFTLEEYRQFELLKKNSGVFVREAIYKLVFNS